MKWSSAVSDSPSLADAIFECTAEIKRDFGDESPDLVMVFVSAHHAAGYGAVPKLVRRHIGEGLLIGCSGGGVIGAGREVEHRPGLAIAAAHLPGVRLLPFHVDSDELPDDDAAPETWEVLANTPRSADSSFILLIEPFSMASDRLLAGLDYAYPGCIKVGGVASAGRQPSRNVLYLRDHVYPSGCVGVSLQGDLEVDTIIARGCRPIGEPMRVTACSGNLLMELDGDKPLEVMARLFDRLSDHDRQLFRHSMFLGIAMDPLNDEPGPGDFVMRNLVDIDRGWGHVVLSETIREGLTVQFHLRDAETSARDLDAVLTGYASERCYSRAWGAALTCTAAPTTPPTCSARRSAPYR